MALQAKQVAFQAEARSLHAAATLGSVGVGVPYPPGSPEYPYYQSDRLSSTGGYRGPVGSPQRQGSVAGGPTPWPSQGEDMSGWPQGGYEATGATPRHFRCRQSSLVFQA